MHMGDCVTILRAPFDTRPLTEPVDGRAVRANAKAVAKAHPGELPKQEVFATAAFVLSVAIVVTVGTAMLAYFFKVDGNEVLATIMVVAPFPVGLVVTFVVLNRRRRRVQERWFRLGAFADANGMRFAPSARPRDLRLAGTPFQPPISRNVLAPLIAVDVVSSAGARNPRIGALRMELGTGRNRTRYLPTFVALDLARKLPHIVLDARANDDLRSSSRLGSAYTSDQRLALEGDFDKDFTLYCPASYGADALYLFTPDIMALLQDHASTWDVEISGDVLYLYAPAGKLGTDPDAWQALSVMINVLGEKLDQWERWRERPDREDVGSGIVDAESGTAIAPMSPVEEAALPVAARGRKLTERLPWWVLPAGIAFVLGTIWLVGATVIGIISDIVEWIAGLFG